MCMISGVKMIMIHMGYAAISLVGMVSIIDKFF